MKTPHPVSFVLLLVLASHAFAQELRKTKVPAEVSALPVTLEAQPPFTCRHEKTRIPQRNAEAQKLFLHAQWRYDKNFYEQQGAFDEVQKLYRIAAAWGHDKAAEKLVGMLREGLVDAPDSKTPPLPSPKRIQEMARAKGLSTQNAWPLKKEAK